MAGDSPEDGKSLSQLMDVTVFRHEGDLVFHVTAFGPSCCEIQYVQSCNNDNLDDDQEDIRNLPMEQSLKTELEAEPSLDDDDEDDNMGKLLRKKHVNKRIPFAPSQGPSKLSDSPPSLSLEPFDRRPS